MNNTQETEQNKMGVLPIGKLIITMSLPMMISMLVQALYNIVDSVFVSKIGEEALRAVSLAFPIQALMIATATGTGVGINSLVSKSLGEKNWDKANKASNNAVFVELCSFLVFILVGLFVSKPFFASQTQNLQVQEYGVIYLTICCCFSIGIFMQITFERLLQATGKTFYTMFTQGIGAIVNLILDPILIFGYLGFPKMGIAGAATATVIGQMVAGALAIFFQFHYNKELHISLKGFRPDGGIIANIYKVGAPSVVMQAIGSVMTYGLNMILGAFDMAQTAFGVYFKLQSFIFMPVFGLNNGVIPIIAYNYGAKNKKRVVEAIKVAAIYAVSIMALGILVMQLFPDKLLGLFEADSTLLGVGIPALRIISTSFLFAGYCIVVGSAFQALGNGIYSMIVSIARQLVVLLPVAYLLSLSGKVELIWLSFPIAELMSVAMTTFFLIRMNKTIISKL